MFQIKEKHASLGQQEAQENVQSSPTGVDCLGKKPTMQDGEDLGKENESDCNISETDIYNFVSNIVTRTQAIDGVSVCALVYLERLLAMRPEIKITDRNILSLVCTSFLLASKVADDCSVVNIDYATILPFSLYHSLFLSLLLNICRVWEFLIDSASWKLLPSMFDAAAADGTK